MLSAHGAHIQYANAKVFEDANVEVTKREFVTQLIECHNITMLDMQT